MKNDMIDLLENLKKYRVKAKSVEDFLDKYYKPDRYTKRGIQYALSLLESYKESFIKNGYCLISHHDSVTGEIVSFFGSILKEKTETATEQRKLF